MRVARRLIAIIVFVGLLVAGWHFAARNSTPITVHHPAGAIGDVQLWVALLVAFGSGVFITAVVGVMRGARIRLVSRRYRKLVESLQAEVHQLRSLPLSDQPSTASASWEQQSAPERGS
jgi:uncharacterized integral membrane protein